MLYKKITEFIPKLSHLTERKINNLIKTVKASILNDAKPEHIPPSPYNFPLYNDDKYILYRNWWHQNRPIPIPKTVLPRLKQMVHFDTHSSLDAEFLCLLDSLPPPLCRNVGRIHQITNLDKIITSFKLGNIIAVSDASVSDDSFASHSYTLVSKDETHKIHGPAPVDCDEDDVESTRAEKCGVLASLTIINILEHLSSTTTLPIPVYCDHDEAVKRRS